MGHTARGSRLLRLAAPGRWRLILAASTACLASCATLQQLSFEPPTVELDTLEITGLDLDGASVVLWLGVYNPNDFEIRTTRVEAVLDLEDTHFGSAALEESVPLGAASRTLIKVPARFTWEGIGAGARALLERGTVEYDLDTRLRLQTSLGSRTVSVRRRGEVPIKDLIP